MSALEPTRVSYLGPEGTFTHLAALFAFGKDAQLEPVASIQAVFQAVARGNTPRGVAPIENSTEGSVGVALDGLLENDLQIEAEIVLQIEQCLLAQHSELHAIQSVVSHPQGLGQCRGWLHSNLPNAELLVAQSTSAAAQEAKRDATVAAVASSLSAELYDLQIVARNIQDVGENITRFVVLSHKKPARTGNDKTSLAFTAPHERGALRRVLGVFDDASINLTRIESRPAKQQKLWEYVFFVDLEGHVEDANVKQALTRLQQMCGMSKVLGSYPRASSLLSRPGT